MIIKSQSGLLAGWKSKYSSEMSQTSGQKSKMVKKLPYSQKNVSQKIQIVTKNKFKIPNYQLRAQNTSLALITAYKSKQQTKSSLKAIKESKTSFKITNLVKKN